MHSIYLVWAMALIGGLGGGLLGYLFGLMTGRERDRLLIDELQHALLEQEAHTEQARRSVYITALASERMDAQIADDLTDVAVGRYRNVQTTITTRNENGVPTVHFDKARVHEQGLWRKQRLAGLKRLGQTELGDGQ